MRQMVQLTVSGPGWKGPLAVNSEVQEESFATYIYILHPADGLLIRPKHVVV
jgi:hypothetical protein